MKHKNMDYDNRYKYKLNMLGNRGLNYDETHRRIICNWYFILGGRVALAFFNYFVFGRSRICCFVNLVSH